MNSNKNNMNTTTTNTNNIFKYFTLSRELDRLGREEGLQHCPDDLLKNIIDYTGDINEKSIGFCKLEIKVNYDKQLRTEYIDDVQSKLRGLLESGRFGWNWEFRRNYTREQVESRIENLEQKRDVIENDGYVIKLQHCECCDKYFSRVYYYENVKSHRDTKTHKKNMCNCKKLDNNKFIKRVKREIKKMESDYDISNVKIQKIIRREWWFVDPTKPNSNSNQIEEDGSVFE